MTVKLGKYHDSSFPLDDVIVPIRIKRLTKDESLALSKEWNASTTSVGPDALTSEARAEAQMAFAAAKIPLYVRVPEGELTDEDDLPVTSGQQVVDLLGARQDVMIGIASLIMLENRVSAAQKKVLRSQLGSALGWPAWISAPSGDAPAPTVTRAVRLISADSAAAMAESPTPEASPDALSGTTDPSSSDPVPSDI